MRSQLSKHLFPLLLTSMLTVSAVAQTGDPLTSPLPDILSLADEEQRGLYLEIELLEDDSVVLLEQGVTNVPPAPTDEAPPVLLFRTYDAEGQLLKELNAWDPRYEYQSDEQGEEVVLLESATGVFQFPFDANTAWITLSNQMVDPPELLSEFEVGPLIEDFCLADPLDYNCRNFQVSDQDGDGVPDRQDQCPGTTAGEPVDSEGCAVSNEFSKQDCKEYGWRLLVRSDGTNFRNQGQCIQYVNTGK